MTVVVYDGSFEGLLTAMFEIYEYKLPQPFIAKEAAITGSLFGETHIVITNAEKSKRVYRDPFSSFIRYSGHGSSNAHPGGGNQP